MSDTLQSALLATDNMPTAEPPSSAAPPNPWRRAQPAPAVATEPATEARVFSGPGSEDPTQPQPQPQMMQVGSLPFCFQVDNVRNQQEHVMMMVANRAHRIQLEQEMDGHGAPVVDVSSRCEAAIADLFSSKCRPGSKLEQIGSFDQYEKWCARMSIGQEMRYIGQEHAPAELTSSVNHPRESEVRQAQMAARLQNLALWWCIWGEAASLRFMPELMCFLFFVAVHHSRHLPRGRVAFLSEVVSPIYNFMKCEAKKSKAGYPLDHCHKLNYDDINEAFWGRLGTTYVNDVLQSPGRRGMADIIQSLVGEEFVRLRVPADQEFTAAVFRVHNYLPSSLMEDAFFSPSCGGLGEVVPAYTEKTWVCAVNSIFGQLTKTEVGPVDQSIEVGAHKSINIQARPTLDPLPTLIANGKTHTEQRGIFNGLAASGRIWLFYSLLFALVFVYTATQPIPQQTKCQPLCSDGISMPKEKYLSNHPTSFTCGLNHTDPRALGGLCCQFHFHAIVTDGNVWTLAQCKEFSWSGFAIDVVSLLSPLRLQSTDKAATGTNSQSAHMPSAGNWSNSTSVPNPQIRTINSDTVAVFLGWLIVIAEGVRFLRMWNAGDPKQALLSLVWSVTGAALQIVLQITHPPSVGFNYFEMTIATTEPISQYGWIAFIFVYAYVIPVLIWPGWVAFVPFVSQPWVYFTGGEMLTSWATALYSSAFWLVFIGIKCFVSKCLTISPAMQLTAFAWSHSGCTVDHECTPLSQWAQNLHPYIYRAVLACSIWTPVWLVFLVDAQIIFTVLQSVSGLAAGFASGMSSRFRTVPALQRAGRELCDNFNFYILASSSPQSSPAHTVSRADLNSLRRMSQSPRELQSVVQSQSRSPISGGPSVHDNSLFRRCWNAMVNSFHADDLCSFEGMFLLRIPTLAMDIARHELVPSCIPLYSLIGCFHESLQARKRFSVNAAKWWEVGLKTQGDTKMALRMVWSISLRLLELLLANQPQLLADQPCFDEVIPMLHDSTSRAGSTLAQLGELAGALACAIVDLDLALGESAPTQLEMRKLKLVTGRTAGAGGESAVSVASQKLLECIKALKCSGSEVQQSQALVERWVRSLSADGPADFKRVIGHADGPSLVATLYHLTKTSQTKALPQSDEIRRRLKFFTESLTMTMPCATSVQTMVDFTTLIPMYGEEVLFSSRHLDTRAGGVLSILEFTKYVESEEYKNMKERLEFQEHVVPHESGDTAHVPYHWQLDLQENACLMTRLWCSYRHQTLARTIRGIHNYEKALALLGEHEIGSNSTAGTTDVKHYALLLARHKCCLVVSCQIFGKWEDDFKRHKAGELATGDAEKFEAICFLMQKYQNLRVAYIDERNSRVYSVLVRGAAAGSTDYYQTVYRIELPGHPIKDGIGEGKPENQNHAMIFTRGTCVQTVDMNQDGYFEECLKVRNILQEFRPAPGTSRPVSIVGFAEHPYSRHFGAASEFAAMEELSFTSVGQRAAQFPFEVRYHYGHPDFHHRIRACTNGSVSKAIKTLCVSEDVYGGWNAVQRNGCILYREYKNVGKGKDLAMEAVSAFQAKIACGSAEMHFSRDYRRILDSQNLARALSMFHSSTGFFWSNVLVVWLVYFTVYEYVFLAMMIPHEHQDELRHMLQAHSSLLSFGLLLALSLFGELMLRHGVMHAVLVFIGLFIRGAPIFYLFQIVWKAKTFLDALTRQTATYRATGRGLILTRSSFATIYRTYSCSHFNLGVEILAGLIAYSYYSEASTLSLANIILPLLLFVGTVILVPFVFNFRQFDQEEIHADWTEWLQFMNEHDSSPGSWQDWYSSQCASYQSPAMTRGFALTMVMRSSLLLLVPFFVILKYSKVILDPKRDGMFVIVIVLLIGLSFASLDSRMHLRHESRLMAIRRRGYRRVCASPCRCIGRCVTEQSFGLVLCGVTLGILSFGTNRLYGSEHHLLIDWTVLLAYTGAWLVNLFFYAGFHCNPWVRKAYYVLDFAVGTMILFILWLVSLFSFVGQMHAQLLFNSVVVRGLSRVEARRTADI